MSTIPAQVNSSPVPCALPHPLGAALGPTLSEGIYGFRWAERLPLEIAGAGVTVVQANYDGIVEFARRHFSEIYKQDLENSSFQWFEDTPAKARYYAAVGDMFLYMAGHVPVGMLVGTPIDWSSYYIRNLSIIPEYQERRLGSVFLAYLMDCLAEAGVARVEADASLANLASIHGQQKLGFTISGINVSERWGAQVHLTCHLDSGQRDCFAKHFCHVKPQPRTAGVTWHRPQPLKERRTP